MRSISLTSSLILFLCFSNLHAAPFPDSGSLSRQFRDDSLRTLQKDKRTAPEVEIEEKEKKPEFDDTHAVYVKGFHVVGSEHLSQDEIHALLDPYIHQNLTTTQIHEAANAFMKYYREKGFFAAKVYLPPHSFSHGIITLHIYEGNLEEDGIELINSEQHVRSKIVKKILTNTLEPGVMKTEDYERAILLVNDLPGISAKSISFPGREVGTANFLMQIEDEDRFNGNVDYDNFGDYYTGENRFGTTLYLHSPTRHGEEVAFRFVTTGQYSNYGYIDVAVPIMNYDLRFGASADYLQYKLNHEFEPIEAKGYAYSGRAYLKYPFIRTRHFNVFGDASYFFTELTDKDVRGTLANRVINSGVFRISGDHDDHFLANGVTYFNAYLTIGDVNLDGSDNYKAFDASTAETAGGFAKINLGISRLQHLYSNFSSYVALSGQISNKNLDTSQKFYLGGPYSVPGYPTGEASGDDGALFYGDLRYDFFNLPWGGNLQLNAFYSCGWINIYHDPWEGWQQDNDIITNDITLQSVGLGLTQTWTDTMVLRMVFANQIGDNNVRDPDTGTARDDSDNDYRFWVNAIVYF